MRKKQFLKWTILSLLVGLLAGSSSAVFLIALNWATEYRDGHHLILWALPIAGLAIGWVYHRYAGPAGRGHNLILDEIHDPKKVLPLRMAPFVLGGTVVTHLFGGSAGREGTAVQMGATLADQLSHWFRIDASERKILLVAGAGAGFGAAIGAPFAGVIFGMEVIAVGRLRLFAIFECLIASFTAYGTTLLLHAPHTHYPSFHIPDWEFRTLFLIAVCGAVFGLVSRAFMGLTHLVENFHTRYVKSVPLRPFLGGLLLAFLFQFKHMYDYAGLGIPMIQNAIEFPPHFDTWFLKLGFTALTIGSGFKGGEFIPLVFVGATLGSALGMWIPISFQLLAGVGFAAVFAGAANTPIACTLMAAEIFGAKILPYAFVACFMSYLFSSHQGIYKGQRVLRRKYHWFIRAK